MTLGLDLGLGIASSETAPNPAPTFTSISPTNGKLTSGTSVTITGTGFLDGGSLGVTIGGSACTSVAVVSSTSITAAAPSGTAGAKDVVVTNGDGQTVTGTAAYTYNAVPTVTSVSPSAGDINADAVTVIGTGFITGATVTFGGSSATGVSVTNSTHIACTTPAHAAGAVDVVVTNPDTQTSTGGTGAYTYTAAPTVTAISKDNGSTSGGTAVTLTGTNFTSATSAAVGGVNLTSFTVVNSTTITGTTGAHAAGLVDATVTSPGGTGTKSNCYYFFVPTDIAGNVLWLRADLGITIGTGVSTWADQSGNSANATQATGSKQPTVASAQINGRDALHFVAASSQYMTGSFASSITTATLFVVGNQSADSQGYFEADPVNVVNTGLSTFNTGGSQFVRRTTTGHDATATASLNANQVITGMVQSTRTDIWTNGTAGTANTDTVTLASLNNYRIGSIAQDLFFLNGYIAEVIVYNSALSSSDRQKVEAYLRNRWGTP